MRRLIEEGRNRATKILTEKRKELEMLTNALIEYETLTKEEMERILKGEKLEKLEVAQAASPPSPPSSAPPLKLPEPLQTPGLNAASTTSIDERPSSTSTR